jgi:uncharacterized membrane protein
MAAIGTAGYSLVDDHMLDCIVLEIIGLSKLEAAILYLALLYPSLSFFVTLFVLSSKSSRQDLKKAFKHEKKRALMVICFSSSAYGLVLLAMQFVEDVSYAVAFRQLSIPIGAILGIYLLGESAFVPKAIGVAVIFIGLMLVCFG